MVMENTARLDSASTVSRLTIVMLMLTYLIPSLSYGFVAMGMGAITLHEMSQTLADPVIYILLLFQMASPILTFMWLKKVLAQYDGSEESIKRTNRNIKLFENISIVLPVLYSFIAPFMYSMRYNQRGLNYVAFGEESPLLYEVTLMLGLTFVLSLFTYIIFLQSLEHKLTWLPYKREYKTMGVVSRSVTSAVFGLLGLVFIMESMFFIPHNRTLSNAEFLVRILPFASIAVIMEVIDFYCNIKDLKVSMMSISGFSNSLSNRDYTMEKIPVTMRCELGEVVNDLNSFSEGTREVASSMTGASKSVMDITNGIDMIGQAITDQAAGVEEADASATQIMTTIRELNNGIENQTRCISESSAAVDEMVANIRSMTQILEKNTSAVNSLGQASDEGRQSV